MTQMSHFTKLEAKRDNGCSLSAGFCSVTTQTPFPGLQRHQRIDYQPKRDDPVVKAKYVQRSQPKLTDEALQEQLRQQLAATAQTHPQLSEFCQQLEVQGITPSFSIRRGKLSGLNYNYQGRQVNGSHLGEAYTFQGLQQQLGIEYQPERDDPVVKVKYVKQRVKDKEMVALTNEGAADVQLEQSARRKLRKKKGHKSLTLHGLEGIF